MTVVDDRSGPGALGVGAETAIALRAAELGDSGAARVGEMLRVACACDAAAAAAAVAAMCSAAAAVAAGAESEALKSLSPLSFED